MSFRAAEEALHEEARQATGFDDFGADDYLEGLRTLLQSLDEEAPLNDVGRAGLRASIVDALQARLHSERGFADYPEYADARVDAPLVIVGLPRTGTTALHHLISQDTSFQGLELWLSSAPLPRPARELWEREPAFRKCDQRVQALYERSPGARAIHPMAADLVDECWHLLSQTFSRGGYMATTEVPSYQRWWEQLDMRPAYRRHRRNLQLIGHREPSRRWLLKDATHLHHLDAFLDVYPDAQVVMTHRDPTRVIPSVCSLMWTARAAFNENVDKKALGRRTLDLWDRIMHHVMEVRTQLDPSQVYDLAFRSFSADALSSIRQIYEHFSLPYSAAADASIRGFRRQNPPGKHGEHTYTLEAWGLDAGEIRERFADYTETFDVEPE